MKLKTMAILAAATAPAWLSASSATWTGSEGNWNDNGNWNAAYPSGANDVATFSKDATVTLDAAGLTDVSYLNVTAGTLTLQGTGDAGLRVNKAVAVYASGLVVGNAASLILDAPLTASMRFDKWYAGNLTIRSTVSSTVVDDANAYGFLIGRGTNVVEGAGAIVASRSGLSIGNGDPATAPTLLHLKDQASLDCQRLWLRVSTAASGPIEVLQDGDDTRVSVVNEIRLGAQANATVPPTYRLRRGNLMAGTLEIGKVSPGLYAQEGGTATVGRISFTTNNVASRLELSGGCLSFDTYSLGARNTIALSGGVLETRHATISLPSCLELSGHPVIAPVAGTVATLSPGMSVAPGTHLGVAGAGTLEPVSGTRPGDALTVDGAVFQIPRATTLKPPANAVEPWKVHVKNGGCFKVSYIDSRVDMPIDLELSDGGKVSFSHDTGRSIFARGVLVAHRYVVDGVEQAKGRYHASNGGANIDGQPGASIVVPYVWTGAGDGANWSDGDNWDGGVVPPNANTTCVDLSRAAGGTILLSSDVTVSFVGFMPSGAARRLTLAGTGSLTVSGTAGYTSAFYVPADAELVLDVNLKRGANLMQPMSFIGGGRLVVRRSFPTISGLPPFAFDGDLVFSGSQAQIDKWASGDAYKILSVFRMEVEGQAKILFEDGCDFNAWRIFESASGFLTPQEILQRGGRVTLESVYLTRHNYADTSPFAYTLEGGELSVTQAGINLGGFYSASYNPRYAGGAFQMSGGTATVSKVCAECCETYCRLTGGVLNLGSGGFQKSNNTNNRDANGGWFPNKDAPLQLGGVTIHPTANATSALEARFTGFDGLTVFDLADGEFTFAQPTTGAGGFVKRGAKTLTFQGANTFTGEVVVEEGLVLFASGSSLDGVSSFTVTGGRVDIQGSVSATPACLNLASADSLVLGANSSFTVSRLFIGGVEQTGVHTFGSGTVTVAPTDEGNVWTASNGGAWSGAANWLNDTPPTVAADFSRAAGQTVSVDVAASLTGLVCRAAGTVTLTAGENGSLTFQPDAVIVVDQGATLVLDVDLALAGYLYKVGSGKLVVRRKVTSTQEPASLTADTSFFVTRAGETEFLGEAAGVRLWTVSNQTSGQTAKTVIGAGAVLTNYATVNAAWQLKGDGAVNGGVVQRGGLVDMTKMLPNFRQSNLFAFSNPSGGSGSYTLEDGTFRLSRTTSSSFFWMGAIGTFTFRQNGGLADLTGLRLAHDDGRQIGHYVLNDGTLQLQTGMTFSTGDYTITLNGGRVEVTGTTALFPAKNAVTLGGCVTFATADGVTATIPCDLAGTGTLVHEGPGTLRATAMLTGPASIEATGGALVLAQPVAATNIVIGGEVDLETDNLLNPATDLAITSGGLLNLEGAGETVVRTLTVNGIVRGAGVYGEPLCKTCSGAVIGTGTLRVLEGHEAGAVIILR